MPSLSYTSPPKIDDRDFEKIIAQFKELIRFYTPEWNPLKKNERDDAGMAVVKIFVSMLVDVIDRLNRVPEKNLIEFLNNIGGADLIPGHPAKAPITFSLPQGINQDVLVNKGVKLSSGSN